MKIEYENEDYLVTVFKELAEEENKRHDENMKILEFVKENINYSFDFIELEDLDYWNSEGFVEVEKIDYKSGSYPNHEFYVEKDNPKSKKYMRQDDEGNYHNMVWQTTGYLGDDYSGFMLFPLSNGKYWKISYSC